MTALAPDTRTTRAVIAFRPAEHCPFPSVDGDIVDAQNSLFGESCHCEYVVEQSVDGGSTVEYTSQEHESDCACHVFGEYDCVPDIIAIEDEEVIVSVFLPEHDVICDLVEDLRSVTDGVALRRLVDGTEDMESKRCEVDLAELTEKQRQALELAIDEGYYEQPRAVSLDDMAGNLDISKQALSQRLNAAEQALFDQLIDG